MTDKTGCLSWSPTIIYIWQITQGVHCPHLNQGLRNHPDTSLANTVTLTERILGLGMFSGCIVRFAGKHFIEGNKKTRLVYNWCGVYVFSVHLTHLHQVVHVSCAPSLPLLFIRLLKHSSQKHPSTSWQSFSDCEALPIKGTGHLW